MERPTKEQIRALPMYEGLGLEDITIVETQEEAALALAALNNETCLGFDTESKPIFLKGQVSPGPTLIQLATSTHAYLFPVRFSSALAAARTLLENGAIEKVGFGLQGDTKELRNKLDIAIVNTKNLSVTLKKLAGEKNPIGARAAVAMVLHKRLGKGAQKSNWGKYPLKNHQIKYAANDANCAICVVESLAIGIH